ncbi:MAG: lipoyl(octanoyl) transferase LipB [Verrucomicrobiota bacterium]|nr:lipoyl(octanoyl) transferase LipB [Verrucomicrobiota bacterium]
MSTTDIPAGTPAPMLSACGQTVDWGLTRYADAVEMQRVQLESRIHDEAPDTLVFTEHKPVFTIGAHPGADKHLLWDEATLAQLGVDVCRTSRGGDITCHCPGQLVGYPIVSLKEARDLHRYLRLLEQVLINACGCFGLAAHRRDGKTGIWLGTRKVAAIGVAVKSWVTWHGFAINVSPDMRYFNGIVPCGITDGTVTSLEKELGFAPPMEEVKAVISTEFWKLFGPANAALTENTLDVGQPLKKLERTALPRPLKSP